MNPPPLPFQLQDPERMRKELAAAGLQDVKVETISETTEFQPGKALWEWVIWSNPIVEEVLQDLSVTDGERLVIQQTLEMLFGDRAGPDGRASVSNPINIGIGTK